MSTPKKVSNQLIRLFFTQTLPGAEASLIECLDNDAEINGGDMVDAVSEFLEACRAEGIL